MSSYNLPVLPRRPDLQRALRLGLRDLGLRAAVASRIRLRRRGRVAAEPDVLPGGRKHDQGRSGQLHLDIGRGDAVGLPEEETERRWSLTNPERRGHRHELPSSCHLRPSFAPSGQSRIRALMSFFSG